MVVRLAVVAAGAAIIAVTWQSSTSVVGIALVIACCRGRRAPEPASQLGRGSRVLRQLRRACHAGHTGRPMGRPALRTMS